MSHPHSWCGMVWYRTWRVKPEPQHSDGKLGRESREYRTLRVNVPPTQLVWNGVV